MGLVSSIIIRYHKTNDFMKKSTFRRTDNRKHLTIKSVINMNHEGSTAARMSWMHRGHFYYKEVLLWRAF